MRKRVYEIIEQDHRGDKVSHAYDVLMLIAITASIIPLMFVEENAVFRIIEWVTVTFFIIDYLLRWMTADIHSARGPSSTYYLSFQDSACSAVDSRYSGLLVCYESCGYLRSSVIRIRSKCLDV